jgi:hypothetical protein
MRPRLPVSNVRWHFGDNLIEVFATDWRCSPALLDDIAPLW